MGLMYVAGAFKQAGVDVTIVDLALGAGDIETAGMDAALGAFDGIGIALVSQANLWSGLSLARDLKNLAPAVPVFAGGVFASLNAQWLLDVSSALDFIVIGEAEPFVNLFVENNGRWEQLPMIWHRAGKGDASSMLPVPVSDGGRVMPDRSLTQAVIQRGESPSVVATRGCGGACSFCCVARYYGSRWQHRSPESVSAELRVLVRDFGVRDFHFVDDNLFGHTRSSQQWIKDLMKRLSGFDPGLCFKATCRLDDLKVSMIPLIRQSGFRLLKVGIETFNPIAQKWYGKPVLREDAAAKLDCLREIGMGISLGFIMFDPYCTERDLYENLDFLEQYREFWGRHLLRSELAAYRGTRIEKVLKRDRLTVSNDITGSRWRFRDAGAQQVCQRIDHLLRTEILGLEWMLYRLQQRAMLTGVSFRVPPGLQDLLQECWILLFRHGLEGTGVASATRDRLGQARAKISAFSGKEER